MIKKVFLKSPLSSRPPSQWSLYLGEGGKLYICMCILTGGVCVLGEWMANGRNGEEGIIFNETGSSHGPFRLKKKKMLVLHAKVLKGTWRLTALVYFSRWQMPFCVLHKLTKFACSLYLFQRQPFFSFNRTEELLGTGTLLVWWGRDEGCSEDTQPSSKTSWVWSKARGWTRALDPRCLKDGSDCVSESQKVSYAKNFQKLSFLPIFISTEDK